MPASRVFKAAPLVILCLACTARPLAGDSATDATTLELVSDSAPSTATSAATTTGSSTTSTTATTAPTSTGEPATDGCGFVCAPDLPPDNNCDGWLMPEQDCPRGQKCTIEGSLSDTHCVDVVDRPNGLYEPCHLLMGDQLGGFDDCGPGLVCWNVDPDTGVGLCIGLCIGSLEAPTCADEAASCTLCQDCALGLCLLPCNPLLQDCVDGQLCIPKPMGDGFACVLDASGDEGQAFDPCEYANACDPGLLCANPMLASECDPMAAGCCLPFCDLSMPVCLGQGQTCLPWYEPNMAPAGLENVGVCGLPL